MLPERVDNLEIIQWPDPRLKTPGKRIEVFDERLKALADRMIELMYKSEGVGLAAPQIGLNLQLFVARAPGQMDEPRAYVNAELTERGGSVTSEEGCLSAPGITIKTKRMGKIGIRAQNLTGEYFEQEADGLLARGEVVVEAHFEAADGGFLHRVASELAERGGRCLGLLTASGDKGDFFVLAAGEDSPVELGVVGAHVAELLDGRGGGSGRIFQGKAGSLDRRTAALALLRDEVGGTD